MLCAIFLCFKCPRSENIKKTRKTLKKKIKKQKQKQENLQRGDWVKSKHGWPTGRGVQRHPGKEAGDISISRGSRENNCGLNSRDRTSFQPE